MAAYHRLQYLPQASQVPVRSASASGLALTMKRALFSSAIFLIAVKSSIEPKKFGY